MKPALHHRICARPIAISWCLGTVSLWIPMTFTFYHEGVFSIPFSEFATWLSLPVIYACLAGFGFVPGVIPFAWIVLRLCRRINGAPFLVGDRVIILNGPHAGTKTVVYELTRNQGGGVSPRVELGAEARRTYVDIVDDYRLLRTPPSPAIDDAPCGLKPE